MSTEPPPSDTPLNGRKILIVEDEAPIALNLAAAVQQAGGIVIGPVASVAGAHAAMADNRLDGALLDIRLRNETSFPLADVLAVLNIPFVFASGLSSALMPYTHRERPLFDKPYEANEVIEALARLVKESGGLSLEPTTRLLDVLEHLHRAVGHGGRAQQAGDTLSLLGRGDNGQRAHGSQRVQPADAHDDRQDIVGRHGRAWRVPSSSLL